MPSSDTIAITLSSLSQFHFVPPDSTVDMNGTVNFVGRPGSVTTLVSGAPKQIFMSGPPPYTVPLSYQLMHDFQGVVDIQFTTGSIEASGTTGSSAGGPGGEDDPTNGTLRVGSTSGGHHR